MGKKVRPEVRYIGIGAGIGFLILLVLGGAAFFTFRDSIPSLPATPAPPTLTPTSTPKIPGTPTPVLAGGLPFQPFEATPDHSFNPPPFPTAAADVIAGWLTDGRISFSGPLSEERQVQLYEASIRYIAPTYQESKTMGERINGTGYGSPDLICGPLSLAILQEAGLVGYDLIPYDFWLLNPFDPSGKLLLAQAFPKEVFEHTSVATRIDRMDWKSFPLMPGDFLYLRAGSGGNFDHMLVVNRVDSASRAYAVTNYGTPDGFIIDEVLLYDPDLPDSGQFRTWTEKPNALLGSTGFGGFEMWRLKGP